MTYPSPVPSPAKGGARRPRRRSSADLIFGVRLAGVVALILAIGALNGYILATREHAQDYEQGYAMAASAGCADR